MGLVVRKLVLGVSDKARLKPACSATGTRWKIDSKFRYDTFQKMNNKGADQTVRMRRLVCDCVVCKPSKTGFLATRPKYDNRYPTHFRYIS